MDEPRQVKLRLPENVAQYLEQWARAEDKPLATFVAEWVTSFAKGWLQPDQYEAFERGEKVDATRAIESERRGLTASAARSAVPQPMTQEPNSETAKLLKHAIYILTRLHVGMYAIPEKHGQMTTEQLREVFEMTRGSAREYMLGLDKHIAKTLED